MSSWNVVAGSATTIAGALIALSSVRLSDRRRRNQAIDDRQFSFQLENLMATRRAIEQLGKKALGIRHSLHGVVGRADVETLYATQQDEWTATILNANYASGLILDSEMRLDIKKVISRLDDAVALQLSSASAGALMNSEGARVAMSDAVTEIGVMLDRLSARVRVLHGGDQNARPGVSIGYLGRLKTYWTAAD